MWVVALVMLAACGRIGFEASGRNGANDANNSNDAIDAPGFPDLVAWYPLDDLAFAGSAADASGGGRHAMCVNCPTTTLGQINGGAAFDGANDFLRIPHDPGLDGTTGFTIACWASIENLVDGDAVVAKPFGPGDRNSWGIEVTTSSRVRFLLAETATTTASLLGPVTIGQWAHYAGTWDQTRARFYIDGAEVDSLPHPAVVWDAQDMTIGADLNNGGTPSSFITGRIDDVRLYSRPLTVTEITTLATR